MAGGEGEDKSKAAAEGTDGETVEAHKAPSRRKSAFQRKPLVAVVKDLPLLSETPQLKREALFKQKLELCNVIFDFEDSNIDTKGKEQKRETLVELTDYINSPVGQKILTEAMMPCIVDTVKANLFRALPPPTADYDPEEDEPAMELTWPHMQIVYELFLRFIVSTEVSGKVSKKFVDQDFLLQWIELFDSEDPRERDYVKTVLHRMYGKFMSHRSFIRKAISQVFFRYIYETGQHNGIGELLEILGSIINGFAIPLKKEHLQFLERALIPLHKPRGVGTYHPQLSYCISQYAEKDPDTISVIVKGLIRYWPWSSAAKQVSYLNELEEVLELCRPEQFTEIQEEFAKLLASCLSSTHFQVAERSLYYWNSEHLCVNVLSNQRAPVLLPYVYGPLSKHAAGHWNQTVENLAQSVLKMYMEVDINLYDKCNKDYLEKQRNAPQERENADNKWARVLELAKAKGVSELTEDDMRLP
jgi:serine/threonine-protein phosphatase 2A regulatory subunit B'